MYSQIEKYIDRLLNESTPDAPLWNIESIKQGKLPHWNYIDGCMLTALLELNKITGEQRYFDFVEQFVDYYVFEDGTIRATTRQSTTWTISTKVACYLSCIKLQARKSI